MNTVILCNRLSRLKPSLRKSSGPLLYLRLVETKDSQRICDYLKQRPDTQELSRSQLFRERSADFRTKYIDFMGQLNSRNHSLAWWAMPFTNKNPIATYICRNASSFLLIAELARRHNENLLVITESIDLAAQVKEWARGEGIKVVNRIRPLGTFRRFFKEHTPAGILKSSSRSFGFWILSRRLKPLRNLTDDHLLIASATHVQSFAEPGSYRDAYFGTLVDQVAASGEKALILGVPVEQPFRQIKKLRALNSGLTVVPPESFLTLRDLLASTILALINYARRSPPIGPCEIDGVDLSCLVRRAVKDARHSGDVFLNIRMYYCAKRLAQTIKVIRCLHPYENRSWEKMLLLGLRSASPGTRMVGFQHAALTPSHTNFIFSEGESEITPLPDVVLTTGEVVKDWLERIGNYPPGIFKTGCALRQVQTGHIPEKSSGHRIAKVLVVLAQHLEEHVDALKFLDGAFASEHSYDVRIRPHPTVSLEEAMNIAPLKRQDFFSPSTGSVADDLQWADVVLYAASTLGLEAVSQGTPAIHLDLGDFLNTDPMFGWDKFKWSAANPSELVETIRSIEAIPENEYLELQQNGRAYGASYLTPVTPDGLRKFLEV